jgi:hypothetical protein
VAAFLRALAAAGIKAAVTSTRRDPRKQAALYANYKRCGCSSCKTRPGRPDCFPAAKPGESTHEKGLAFDLQLTPPHAYDWAGALWESWGFTWGGRFDDPIHFDFRRRTG